MKAITCVCDCRRLQTLLMGKEACIPNEKVLSFEDRIFPTRKKHLQHRELSIRNLHKSNFYQHNFSSRPVEICEMNLKASAKNKH